MVEFVIELAFFDGEKCIAQNLVRRTIDPSIETDLDAVHEAILIYQPEDEHFDYVEYDIFSLVDAGFLVWPLVCKLSDR